MKPTKIILSRLVCTVALLATCVSLPLLHGCATPNPAAVTTSIPTPAPVPVSPVPAPVVAPASVPTAPSITVNITNITPITVQSPVPASVSAPVPVAVTITVTNPVPVPVVVPVATPPTGTNVIPAYLPNQTVTGLVADVNKIVPYVPAPYGTYLSMLLGLTTLITGGIAAYKNNQAGGLTTQLTAVIQGVESATTAADGTTLTTPIAPINVKTAITKKAVTAGVEPALNMAVKKATA